jgi:hypothetical protein
MDVSHVHPLGPTWAHWGVEEEKFAKMRLLGWHNVTKVPASALAADDGQAD